MIRIKTSQAFIIYSLTIIYFSKGKVKHNYLLLHQHDFPHNMCSISSQISHKYNDSIIYPFTKAQISHFPLPNTQMKISLNFTSQAHAFLIFYHPLTIELFTSYVLLALYMHQNLKPTNFQYETYLFPALARTCCLGPHNMV